MNIKVKILLLSLIFFTNIQKLFAQEPLTKIAFGSCAKQDKPQPIWDSIIERNPQLFLFLGDNIYGDTEDMNLLKKNGICLVHNLDISN